MGSSPSYKDIFIRLSWAIQGRGIIELLQGATDDDRATEANKSGIRPGEVTVALPAETDAGLYFIGRIRTPWKQRKDCPKNAREARERGIVCTIEVDPRWAAALGRRRNLLAPDRALLDGQGPARPGDPAPRPITTTGRATFALRSPVRPNPIALSVVEARQGRGHAARGDRPRLPGRHAAARHQALFRLDRFHPGRPGRLARGIKGRCQPRVPRMQGNSADLRISEQATLRLSPDACEWAEQLRSIGRQPR